MNKLLFIVIAVCLSQFSYSQSSTISCGSGRYYDDVFVNYTKTTGITYGFNSITDYSTSAIVNQELKFDFYEPTGDLAVKRPLIILMFGGGFIGGQRSNLNGICLALARKGYTTATIDYRLISNNSANFSLVYSSKNLLADEMIKASSDLKAAIRFFKHNAATSNTFKIDTSKIIVGGISAGSIAAFNAAYIDDIYECSEFTSVYNDNGGFEGNTDLPSPNNLLPAYNSKGIAGFFNLAGAIIDTALIDSNDPPIYSSQGAADEVVPYNYGIIQLPGLSTATKFYGSNLIAARTKNIGLKNEVLPISGGDHASPLIDPYIRQNINNGSSFFESIICNGLVPLPVTLTSFLVKSENCNAVLHWKTVAELQSSYYEIEVSADGVRFSKIATVTSENSADGKDYSYAINGFSQPALFRLKMIDKDGRFSYSGVQQFSSACAPSVNIYPNPAKDFATVSGLQAGMRVQLVNASGKLIFAQKSAGATLQIPLSTFSNGLLMVQVIDKNGKLIKSGKLLKN